MNEHSIFIFASGILAVVVVCLVGWINVLQDRIEALTKHVKQFEADINTTIGKMNHILGDAVKMALRKKAEKQEEPTQEMEKPSVRQAKNWRSVQEFLQPK